MSSNITVLFQLDKLNITVQCEDTKLGDFQAIKTKCSFDL